MVEAVLRRRAPRSVPDRRAGVVLLVLLTGQFMANVDTAVTYVAVPAIGTDLHASGGQLQLVASGSVLAYAMLLIIGARLGATYGYRRVFLVGLGGFTLTSLACGLAPDPVVLIAARIAQGAAAAIIVPQVLTVIQRTFSGAGRARAVGYYALALSGGAVAGQVLGGVLVSADLFGMAWRPVFLVNVPLGAVLVVAAARVLPHEPGPRGQRMDLAGVAVLSASVLLAVVPLVLGRGLHWPLWTWPCLAASVAGVVGFVAVERRVAARRGQPLVNLGVLRRPVVGWGLLASVATGSTYFSLLFVLALYLQQGLGRSPMYSGLALVSWVAAFGLAGPLARRLRTRPGRGSGGAVAGALIMAGAYAAISVSVFTHLLSGPLLISLLGVGGFGLGVCVTGLLSLLTRSVPADLAPDLSGLIPMTSQLGGALGVATFGTAYIALADVSATRAFMVVTGAFAVGATGAAIAARRSATGATTPD